jgi:hypothetical protein
MYSTLLAADQERQSERWTDDSDCGEDCGRRLQEEMGPYPMFNMFDSNRDGLLSANECMKGMGETPMTYERYFNWATSNAADICQDPRSVSEDIGGDHSIWGPLSEMYFALDSNYDGFITPEEYHNWFKAVDSN